MLGDLWWFLGFLGDSWINGGSWLFLLFINDMFVFLMVLVGSYWLLVVICGSW